MTLGSTVVLRKKSAFSSPAIPNRAGFNSISFRQRFLGYLLRYYTH
jgi:hypothetical protein